MNGWFMIGKTISHYRILEKLGEGGMGVVYKAEDLKLHRLVALKFLHPQALSSEKQKRRFAREAQAAASLSHPNIATIYEFDESPGPDFGQAFIAMEYVDGETLKQKIARAPLMIDEAIDITFQLARGLLAAHQRGVINRDIKPANIIITNEGTAKILDFGLARLMNVPGITDPDRVVGTVAAKPQGQVGHTSFSKSYQRNEYLGMAYSRAGALC